MTIFVILELSSESFGENTMAFVHGKGFLSRQEAEARREELEKSEAKRLTSSKRSKRSSSYEVKEVEVSTL